MTRGDLIFLATKAFANRWDDEHIFYSDDLSDYSRVDRNLVMDTILDFLEEITKIGKESFYEKYKEYKLY